MPPTVLQLVKVAATERRPVRPTPPDIHLAVYVFDEMSERFFILLAISRSPMDSSWNDGYENTDLDEFIFNEFIDSLESDDEDAKMLMLMSIQEKVEKAKEHILN